MPAPTPAPSPTPTPAAAPTLTTLTTATDLTFLQAYGDLFNPSETPTDLGTITRVNLDPASATLGFTLASTTTSPPMPLVLPFSLVTRDTTASDTLFARYRGTAGPLTYEGARLLPDPAAARLALRYAGYADLLAVRPGGARQRYLIGYGLPASAAGMPASGSIHYAGYVFGYGSGYRSSASGNGGYDTYGTYSLFGEADFILSASSATARRFDGTLSTLSVTVLSGQFAATAPRTITLRYPDIANPASDGVAIDTYAGITHQGSGTTRGQFFGPNGEEFVGTLTFSGRSQANSPDSLLTVVTNYTGIVVLRRVS